MGRKIALVGALLVAAGIALLATFVVPPSMAPVTPMGRGLNYLLGFLLPAASLVLTTGAVLLAFTVLVALTGRLPVHGRRTALLTAGLGVWVLGLVVESALVPLTMSASAAGPVRSGLVLLDVGFVLRTGAAVLLALWVVGLLRPAPGHDEDAADVLRAEDELRA